MKKTYWIVLVLVAIVIVVGLVSGNKKSDNDGPIKIGFIGPLTGDAASYGEPVKQGIEVAVDEINAAGGIRGRMIEVIYEDGKCSGKDAANAAQKLVSIDKVKIIIGGACSGETLAAAPITEQAKVILFSTASSSPAVTTAGDYVFRNQPSDLYSGDYLAKAVIKNYKSVAVVSETTDFAQAIRKVFTESFATNGGAVLFDESYAPGTKDFRSIVAKVVSQNPEAIYMNAQSPLALVQFMNQLRQAKYQGQVYSTFLTGPEVVKSGDAVNGVIMLDLPDLEKTEVAQHLLTTVRAKYGKEPAYPNFMGASYDAVKIIAAGLKKYGEDNDAIRDYIYGIKNYQGTIGSYSFDSNGDISGMSLKFRKIVNNELVDLD